MYAYVLEVTLSSKISAFVVTLSVCIRLASLDIPLVSLPCPCTSGYNRRMHGEMYGY